MPSAPDRAAPPEIAAVQERNWFYESLSIEARDRFLETLASARERGLSEQAAWEEAVVAAETAYVDEDEAPGAADGLDPAPPAGP